MQKTSIFGHLGQKGPFWTVFGQNGQNGENFQKSAWIIFLAPKSPNCKVSEKSNERFPRKSVTDVRTDGRTNERTNATPKVSTTSWSRDQQYNYITRPHCSGSSNNFNLQR